MIIGLTGSKASGKGEVSKILKQKGFIYSWHVTITNICDD